MDITYYESVFDKPHHEGDLETLENGKFPIAYDWYKYIELSKSFREKFPLKSYRIDTRRKSLLEENMKGFHAPIHEEEYKLLNYGGTRDLRFEGRYLLIGYFMKSFGEYIDINFYDNLDILAEYFAEIPRLHAKIKGKEYPVDYYQKNIDTLVRESLEKYGKISYDSLEDIFYEKRVVPTEFKLGVGITILKILCSRLKMNPSEVKILDPCAGRGVRLLSAISLEMDYVGVDPGGFEETEHTTEIEKKQNLKPVHDSIIKEFNYRQARFHYEPFESTDLEKNHYDIIFTSPPYFDYEHYSDREDQSDVKFKTLNSWKRGFLKPFVKNCIVYCRRGGLIAINFAETVSGEKYLDYFIDLFMGTERVDYLGCIGYSVKNPLQRAFNPQPTFVFQKR